MNVKSKIYKLFNMIFSIVFAVILIGTIFDNQSQIKAVSALPLILCALIIGVVVILMYTLCMYIGKKKLSDNTYYCGKISIKKEIIIFLILISCIIGLEIICGMKLRVSGERFDLINIISMADNIANNRNVPVQTEEYYTVYPDTDFIMYIMIFVYKIFLKLNLDKYNALVPGIVFNIIMVTASIITFYFIIRKLYNNTKALVMLGGIFLITPIFLYIPIFYTDTLSMFFVVMIYYLYLLFRENPNNIKKVIYFILLNIVAIIGIKIKSTVAIMVIAMYIDLIINSTSILFCVFAITYSIVTLLLGNMLINNSMNNSGYFNLFGFNSPTLAS